MVRKAFLGFTQFAPSQVQRSTVAQSATLHFTTGGKGVLVALDKDKTFQKRLAENSQSLQFVEKRAIVVSWSAIEDQTHISLLQVKNTTTGR